MVIVVSKVKAMAKAVDLRLSQEACEAISGIVQQVVIESAKAAKAEKIGTIKKRHIPGVNFVEQEEE